MGGNQKEKDKITIIYAGVIGVIASIFLALHAGMSEATDVIGATLYAITSFIDEPFNIHFHLSFFKWLIFYLLAVGVGLIALYAELEKNRRIDKNPGGKAKWYEDLKKFKKKYTDTENPFNNIILTKDVSLSMNSRQTMRNNNVLVIGGSGAGKTRFMIKPNIMNANCSMVITDPKGEILEAEGEMLKKHGYKIKVFNLVDMKHSNSYNPFEYIRDDLGVLMMINCLIKNTNNGQKGGGDPFWEKSETALLQALVFYLKDNPDIPKEYKNFTNVMKLLQAADVNENDANAQSPLDKLFAKVEAKDPNSLAVKQYKTFKMGAGKTLKSILISCGVRLTVFNLPEIEDLTMKDDLDLASIGDEKTALFVVIPSADDTYNFLVSMMYSQLFETLYYRAENECPYEYYLKDGVDVLAIARKNKKGDKYTEKDAKSLQTAFNRSRIKVQTKNKIKTYVIEAKGVRKEFYTQEEAEQFKERVKKAKIVKGAIRLPYPVRFLLDEFANIGQIPDFTKKLATMRQYEISCTIILQNLAQIKNMYKDDYGSILGNCDSFLFLGGQEYDTLKYISDLLGKKTIVNRGRGRSKSGKGGNSSQNDSQQGVPLMEINQLSTMPKDECILVINGLDPFYGKKYDLTKHPNFKDTGDSKTGKKFDCKNEIFNYGLLNRKKDEKKVSEKEINKGIEAYVGPAKSLDQTFQEANVKTVKDAVNRIILKKGEVIVNEKENAETGDMEFDYNVE